MQNKDSEQIMRKFATIKGRQLFAAALALSAIIILAVVSNRPDLFGRFSKHTIIEIQLIVILAFINFTAWNWKCPSCKKYLGHDIAKVRCRKCGTRLQ